MFLWAGVALLSMCALTFFTLALKRDEGKRRYHYLATAICSIATLAYYCMARGFGSVALFDPTVLNCTNSPLRVFFWIRYIDWLLTTPMLIVSLCFLAGTTKRLTYGLIFSDAGMIITGLLGVLMTSDVKWLWYGVSCLCMVPIVWSLIYSLERAAREKSKAVHRTFSIVSWSTVLIWTVYPVIWVLAEGMRFISLDTEIALYCILDVSAKGGMSLILLLSKTSIEVAELQEIDSVFSTLLNIKAQPSNPGQDPPSQDPDQAQPYNAHGMTQDERAAQAAMTSGRSAAMVAKNSGRGEAVVTGKQPRPAGHRSKPAGQGGLRAAPALTARRYR